MESRAPAATLTLVLLPVCLGAVLLGSGCGGRTAARPVAEPPPYGGAPRPASEADEVGESDEVGDPDAAEPAVRLDEPAGVDRDTTTNRPRSTDRSRATDRPRAMEPDRRYHQLQAGQTLYSLARAYGVPLDRLMAANGISDPTTIRAGTAILIPGLPGSLPDRPREAPPAPRSSVAPRDALPLVWPLRGSITAPFGRRGRHRHHAGIDIDGVKGEAIVAAAAGTVVEAGYGHGYGHMVVIDHGAGVVTLYAHASRLLVREGDRVERGEAIAEVGRSGNAHGTHLHFEVHKDGRPVDPLPILRSGAVAVSAPRRAPPESRGDAERSASPEPPFDEEGDSAH